MADDKRLFLTIANDLASVNDVLSKMAEIGKDELSLDELFVLSEFVRGAKRNVEMECESLKSVKALETKELGGIEAWRG